MMTLEQLGYTKELEAFRKEENLDVFEIARVISEHKERYMVSSVQGDFEAEIIGNMRFTAEKRSDFPAVGDWVAISEYDEHKVLIHRIYPRNTIIERQAVGKTGEKQIIASNIDFAFIVLALDRDFNINRIERYLTICNAAHVEAIIVLSKADLINGEDLMDIEQQVQHRIKGVPVFSLSNENNLGIEELKNAILPGKTYCLLGSSGVGKSTLSNKLSGNLQMKTNEISSSTGKGRHVTSHRELLILDNGGILIDNPGMREVGIADSNEGLDITFDAIIQYSSECKYKDCSHVSEQGCAVIMAVENDEIDRTSYNNYLKMEREKEHFESTVAERRKKDKDFGKMVKRVMKSKKSNRSE